LRNHKQEKGKLEDQRTMLYGARKFKKEYETDAEMLGEFLDTITKDEKIILSGCHFNVVFTQRMRRIFAPMNRWWLVSSKTST